MIKSIPLAILVALAIAGPVAAVDLEYNCGFDARVGDAVIYGAYRVGPDGEIRDRQAGWKFDSGPAVEDMGLLAFMVWREGAFRLKSVTVEQNVVTLPSVETSVRVSLPAGPAIDDTFITLKNIREWRGGSYGGYGKGIWIGAPPFLEAMWVSDRMDVVVTEKGGAELLRRTYALPMRDIREAFATHVARLDAWVAKRDFSRCIENDLDEEPDVSAVI